jgi:hypothetical protein
MDDAWTYQIEICGEVDDADLNSGSPLRVTVEHAAANRTVLTVYTDQSGLIGVLRHIHGLGMVLLAVVRRTEGSTPVRPSSAVDLS